MPVKHPIHDMLVPASRAAATARVGSQDGIPESGQHCVEPIFGVTKRCVKCHEVKPIEEFGRHDSTRDGHQSYCKRCRNGLHKVRRDRDPAFYLTHHIATRVRQQVGAGMYPEGFTTDIEKHLGYPIWRLVRELNTDLARREGINFYEARRRDYHVDHKVPLTSFNVEAVDSESFRRCWHYTNLWMIPREKNLEKGARIMQDEADLAQFSGQELTETPAETALETGPKVTLGAPDLAEIVSKIPPEPLPPPAEKRGKKRGKSAENLPEPSTIDMSYKPEPPKPLPPSMVSTVRNKAFD